MTNDSFPPAPRRTWFTTLLGVATILLGGLGTLFSLFLLVLAIGKPYATACFWFTARGLDRGEIRLPVKHNPASRIVSRAEKPALFWTSLATLALLGTASTGFAIWLVAARRSNPKTS